MATAFNIHEAKTHFSSLVERVERGEELVISRAGRPVARLVPIAQPNEGDRVPGARAGGMWMADDFDDPLPPDFLSGNRP